MSVLLEETLYGSVLAVNESDYDHDLVSFYVRSFDTVNGKICRKDIWKKILNRLLRKLLLYSTKYDIMQSGMYCQRKEDTKCLTK